MEPFVSVIIPAYNAEESISKTIESVINQISFSNYEILVIDDGSYDNTSRIIKDYTEINNRIKYFYQDNAGVSIARNNGLSHSRGKYICFLDSDDYYERNYLSEMYIQIKNSNSDVCYCGYNIITPDEVRQKKTNFKEGDILIDYILGRVSVQTTGWMISSELIKKNNIQFPEKVSWGEDFEFFCMILAHTKKVTFVRKYLTNYKFNFSESQLSSFSMDKIKKDYDSINRVQKNSKVNCRPDINKALINYRLSAVITYQLLHAVKINANKEDVLKHFELYERYIKNVSWNNGLRSFKLNIAKMKLFFHLNKN